MTDKDTKSKAPVELKDADLDKVAGGLFSASAAGTEVVSGPIPGEKKGDGLVSFGTEASTLKDGGTKKYQDGDDLL